MIKKSSVQETEVRDSMRGGPGQVTVRHYFKKHEINARCRLCAQLTLLTGAGIGLHEHAQEDELFIIQQGRAILNDGMTEVEVEAGDAILTGRGQKHAITNIGQVPLVITAVIMEY